MLMSKILEEKNFQPFSQFAKNIVKSSLKNCSLNFLTMLKARAHTFSEKNQRRPLFIPVL